MATYKNISSKYILGKIYRDLGLEDTNYDVDIIEWIGEALEFIGSSTQLSQETKQLPVANFRATIPNTLVAFIQVRMKKDDCYELIKFNPSSFFGHEPNCANLRVKSEEFYTINPNYINTSFEEGELLISYKALPTDEEGFPLIPDNQYFKDAMFWYTLKKLIMRGYQPRVKEINYFTADQKWQFYCTAARNQANYPDLAEYERFMNVWKGLIPDTSLIDREFDDSQTDKVELDVIDASNTVTNPNGLNDVDLDGGTVGGDGGDSDDDTAPTIDDKTITVEET